MKLKSLILGIVILTAVAWGVPQEGYSYSFTAVQTQVQEVAVKRKERKESPSKVEEKKKNSPETGLEETVKENSLLKGAPPRASP
ncbi:hypothetical protein [Thermovibrio sp.]